MVEKFGNGGKSGRGKNEGGPSRSERKQGSKSNGSNSGK